MRTGNRAQGKRKSMKRLGKCLLALVLCAVLAQAPAPLFALSGEQTVQAASVKSGLKKENGKYYYYVKGKKVENTWITVKVSGKSYKYYFAKNGAAYMGSKTYGASVKKINGKSYAFDKNARMVKGLCVSNYKFYYFSKKTGVYDSAVTKKFRAASKYEKSSKDLKALLKKYVGNPVKTEKTEGCYSKYKDTTCYYSSFLVVYGKQNSGKEVFLEIAAR